MNLPYGQPRLLSDGSARDTSPSWSPDGSKVLFIREVDGVTTRVHVMNADGTGVVQLTSDASGLVEEFSPVWRPQPKR
jgi:TolB protein